MQLALIIGCFFLRKKKFNLKWIQTAKNPIKFPLRTATARDMIVWLCVRGFALIIKSSY